jgi:peptidoglycan/xylan/chitin deacetylase (PgdA/CDA1 family)
MDICHRQDIRATFFFTAQSAELYGEDFEALRAQGHEIGCHGLTHGTEEDYDRMPEDMQRRYIAEATERLQELSGERVRAFRGPRVKTSATTLKLLAEQGYTADSSVCSQRMDLISSNLINIGWVLSPRRPYRPNHNSAFKTGEVPIWEIPVSAMGLPFISSALKALGLWPMKTFFKLLYAEARRTGKPIVYLAHPVEFLGRKHKSWKSQVKRKYLTLSYIRAHGLRLRNQLYRLDGKTLHNASQELLAYMACFPDISFMTVSEYTKQYLEETASLPPSVPPASGREAPSELRPNTLVGGADGDG